MSRFRLVFVLLMLVGYCKAASDCVKTGDRKITGGCTGSEAYVQVPEKEFEATLNVEGPVSGAHSISFTVGSCSIGATMG